MLRLSVIIPVRNEAAHIAEVLDRLLAQHYEPNRFEILAVDGLSTDQTPAILREYARKYPNVRCLENPKKLASAARNVGVQQSIGEAVLIVDGHCIIDNDDMLKNVDAAFERSGADALARPQPLEMSHATPMQWAIASARRSPLGHHPNSLIYSDQAQFAPASSAAIAYRKSVFEKAGYFDERFDAAEDVEFNTRVDKAGLTCYFDPAIAVRYVPRKTLAGLTYQMSRYGRGRVRLCRKHRETFSLKSFAPGLFVFGAAAGLPLCFIHWLFLWSYLAVMGLYLAAILAETLRLAIKQRRLMIALYLPLVFPAIHFGYGYGIWREFIRPARNGCG